MLLYRTCCYLCTFEHICIHANSRGQKVKSRRGPSRSNIAWLHNKHPFYKHLYCTFYVLLSPIVPPLVPEQNTVAHHPYRRIKISLYQTLHSLFLILSITPPSLCVMCCRQLGRAVGLRRAMMRAHSSLAGFPSHQSQNKRGPGLHCCSKHTAHEHRKKHGPRLTV